MTKITKRYLITICYQFLKKSEGYVLYLNKTMYRLTLQILRLSGFCTMVSTLLAGLLCLALSHHSKSMKNTGKSSIHNTIQLIPQVT